MQIKRIIQQLEDFFNEPEVFQVIHEFIFENKDALDLEQEGGERSIGFETNKQLSAFSGI